MTALPLTAAARDLEAIGSKVLETLARGRELRLARRRARALDLRELVERAARLDRAAGKPERGRAGRIARRLSRDGVVASERHILKIIRNCGAVSSATEAPAVVTSVPLEP